MRKVLLLLSVGFEVFEASVFIDVLGWNMTYGSKDIELITCARTKNLKSTFGLKIEVDITIDEVDPDDFVALAIPGGFETYGFYEDAYSKEFQQLIIDFNRQDKIIASICVGALPIGKSGILKGKEATTYHLSGGKRQDQLKEFGVSISNQPIVNNGNIITSSSPGTAIDVAFSLLEKLTGNENTAYIREQMGFGNEK